MAAKRYSFVFYVAILVAIAATYSVFKVLESTKASSRVATAPVVIAAKDINEGEIIDRIALSVAQWPISTVPVGAYGRVDSVAGRVTRVPVFNGEPIVPGRLAPEGTEPGLTSKITPGKRAKSIRVNDVSGIAGLIQPNSRVDIVLTTTLSNAARTGKIFMQNMRVLAMQTATAKTEDGRPIPATVATLEVTPQELELLTIAQATGTLELALRGYGDPDSVRTGGANTADLERALREGGIRPSSPPPRRLPNVASAPRVVPETVIVRPPAVVPKAPPKPDSAKVEVFRGGTKTEQKFSKDSVRKDSVRRDTIPNN
jgi:pilus assembly protein CpaB